MPGSAVTIDHIRAAALRIAPYVHRTPVLSSRLINAEAGCEIVFKCENLQKVGAFKARGAHNAVLCLSREQLARGVATHSSGNHAAALALAASHFGVPAYIVMPDNAPASKVAAVGLAVVLQHARRFAGKRVAIVFSGGNVDIDQLPW